MFVGLGESERLGHVTHQMRQTYMSKIGQAA
jgi:hypothetical protein